MFSGITKYMRFGCGRWWTFWAYDVKGGRA